jgi:hypothetical protein
VDEFVLALAARGATDRWVGQQCAWVGELLAFAGCPVWGVRPVNVDGWLAVARGRGVGRRRGRCLGFLFGSPHLPIHLDGVICQSNGDLPVDADYLAGVDRDMNRAGPCPLGWTKYRSAFSMGSSLWQGDGRLKLYPRAAAHTGQPQAGFSPPPTAR